MRLKADLTLLLVSIIWGSAFVAQRVAGQMGSVYLFNGARYLLAALVVLPLMVRARRKMNPHYRTPREQYKWMFIAGLLLFIGSAFQQAGMVYTTAGNAGFISGLYVVFVPFALLFLWKEKPHWLSIVAVVLAGAGAFLLSTGGRPVLSAIEGPALSAIEGFELRAGDVLELIGALFWTFHVIVLGKYASKFEALSFSVGQLVVCSVLNLTVGFFTEPLIPLSRPLIYAVVYTAFFALGLCYTLQIWAQRHTPPADAALILSLESVFAVISGWLILNEKLVAIQILGCLLIFIAVLLSQFKEWTSGKLDYDHLIEGR